MIAIRQLEALVKSERLRVVALGDMVMENDDVRRVTHLVSEETGIRERVILSNHPRPTDVCDARFLLSWLLREVQPRTSATSLGRATGTDHSGFLHRVRRARDLMETNASFKARALRLRDMLLTTEEKP
jgi:chromosomal replication initiation ATPase DnaA